MLFHSFFKSLIGCKIVVELKNDLSIEGTLQAVDQYLNLKLKDVKILEEEKYPYLMSVKNTFIRGSVVRFVHLRKEDFNPELLEDSARVEQLQAKQELNALSQ